MSYAYLRCQLKQACMIEKGFSLLQPGTCFCSIFKAKISAMFKLLSLVSILGTGSCQLYPTTGGINVKIILNLLMFYWNCLFAMDRSMHKFLAWIDFIPRYMYFQNVCSCASLKANFLTLRRSFVACSIRQIAGEDLPPCCHQMTLTGPGINMPVFQTDPLFSSCLNDFL